MHQPIHQPVAPSINPEAFAAFLNQYQAISQVPLGFPVPAPAPVVPTIDPNIEITSVLGQLQARINMLETEASCNKRRCDDDGDGGNADDEGDAEVTAGRRKKKNRRTGNQPKQILTVDTKKLNSAQMSVRGELTVRDKSARVSDTCEH
jgi:hypothetical protein